MNKLICVVLVAMLATSQATAETEESATFKQVFSDSFLVGVAISENQIMGRELLTLSVVRDQFNALTAENEMKWERLQPEEGDFRWTSTDTLVEFCQENDIFVTGHTLVWHSQTPDWVFEDADGNPASRELLLARMEKHITTIVSRYKGRIPSWDVVNEALEEDGSLRDSKWLQIIGPDFVEKAFEFAHEADPEAELYYNDYNLYSPKKSDGAVRLVKSLQDKGIRVDGIGMQGHYGLDSPADLKLVEDSIKAFGALGSVMITELDISVLPFPDQAQWGADISIDLELNAKYNPYPAGLPEEIEQAQTERYVNLFRILLDNSEHVSRVTFWGFSNAHSWKNGWPMQGRTDYPLMIDRHGNLRPVAYEIFKLVP